MDTDLRALCLFLICPSAEIPEANLSTQINPSHAHPGLVDTNTNSDSVKGGAHTTQETFLEHGA